MEMRNLFFFAFACFLVLGIAITFFSKPEAGIEILSYLAVVAVGFCTGMIMGKTRPVQP